MRKVNVLIVSALIVAFNLTPRATFAAPACSDAKFTAILGADLDDITGRSTDLTKFTKDNQTNVAAVQSEYAKFAAFLIDLRHKYEDTKTTPDCEAMRAIAVEFISSATDITFFGLAEITLPSENQYGTLISDAYDRLQQINGRLNGNASNAPKPTAAAQSSGSGAPLVFKGNGDKVLDPITLGKGLYKVSVVTKEAFALYVQSLNENACESAPGLLNELNTDGNQAISAQTLYTVNADCKVVLSTQNSSNDWTVTIEPVQ